MNWKYVLAGTLLVVCILTVRRCGSAVQANRRMGLKADHAAFTKSVDGYKIQLIGVQDASHANQPARDEDSWTPDGFPLPDGSRDFGAFDLPRNLKDGWPRRLLFLVQLPTSGIKIPPKPGKETDIDVITYLPQNNVPNDGSDGNPGCSGPLQLKFWIGAPQVPGGPPVVGAGSAARMAVGVTNTKPQPVVFGIASGNFRVIAKGPASVVGISEGSTETIASGPWGRIEATHQIHPKSETSPTPTHHFRLLGGPYPPTTERKVFFYNAKGVVITTCGDGQNNLGYMGPFFNPSGAPGPITHFEIQERPYAFVQFNEVNFDPPEFASDKG